MGQVHSIEALLSQELASMPYHSPRHLYEENHNFFVKLKEKPCSFCNNSSVIGSNPFHWGSSLSRIGGESELLSAIYFKELIFAEYSLRNNF
jgi:hypothetical protein